MQPIFDFSHPAPNADVALATSTDEQIDEPVVVVLYNDDVNTFEFVTFVLKRLLGVSALRAEAIALEVHTSGSSELKRCARPEAEQLVLELTRYSLTAGISQ